MLTTIKVKGAFSPARTMTIAGGSDVDFWSMQPQRGHPEVTRHPNSNITRQFDKVASIKHEGDYLVGGERPDWRPHGASFVQIVGGVDDKLWVAANTTGLTLDTSVAGCTSTDCSAQYNDGYTDGRAAGAAEWDAWLALKCTDGGGGGSGFNEGDDVGGTAVVINVPDTGASVQLLSANANRLSFRIQNDSTVPLYVKYGAGASLSSFTVTIPANGFFAEDNYSGRVDGIWSSDAGGSARITEITP